MRRFGFSQRRHMKTLLALAPMMLASLSGQALAQNQVANFAIGTTAQYDVPNAPILVPTTGITVEAWVTYDDSTVPVGAGLQFPSICRHTLLPDQLSYAFRVEAGDTGTTALRFLVNSQGFGIGAADAQFMPGELTMPTHVAGTFDGQNYSVYINGVLRGTAAFPGTGTIVNGGGDLVIGNGGDGVFTTETTWNGEIDELRIWPFARTQEEIVETMNSSLILVPGGVTFNIDGAGVSVDSSQGLVATPTPTVTISAGQNLPIVAAGGFTSGVPTTTCTQELGASVGSSTRATNTTFDLVCYDGTPNATGGVLVSLSPSPVPTPLLGADFFLDFSMLVPVIPSVVADATGGSRLRLPINRTAPGTQLASQFFFLDPCGPMGITASETISISVQ